MLRLLVEEMKGNTNKKISLSWLAEQLHVSCDNAVDAARWLQVQSLVELSGFEVGASKHREGCAQLTRDGVQEVANEKTMIEKLRGIAGQGIRFFMAQLSGWAIPLILGFLLGRCSK